MNFKVLYFLFLLPILSYSQSLELSFKQYNYNGRYGIAEMKSEYENASNFESFNNYVLGFRARYIKKNNLFWDVELKSLLGTTETRRTEEGVTQFKIRSNPQWSNILLGGIGKYIYNDKLRFSPSFKLGVSYTKPGVIYTRYAYENGILKQKDQSSQARTVSVLTGPSMGFDYMVFKNLFFGLDIDYLLYMGLHSDNYTREVINYEENGDIKNSSLYVVKFDSKFINLNNLGVSWSITYRIY